MLLVLLVVYYLMVTDYLKQRRESKTLASQIAETTQQLENIPPPPADLEQRLNMAQSDYELAKNAFPERLNTTNIINGILKLAENVGVKAIPLVTQPWLVESISSENYSVFRLSVTATGTYSKLADFISQLENGEPGTLVIESIVIELIPEISGEEGMKIYEARMEIAIYARPPAANEPEKVD